MTLLTSSTGMTAVTDGITAIVGVASTMLDTILGNPVFAALFAVGFVGIGISLVKRFRNSGN